MAVKRILSLFLIAIILIPSVFSVTFFAQESIEIVDSEEDDESDSTEKPTQQPTEEPAKYPALSVQNLGYAKYAEKLDTMSYTGKLGALYSEDSTTFRLWSPVADSVKVCIYKTGTDEEENAQMLSSNSMEYSKKYGTWYITLQGDYKGLYYTYLVDINGQKHEIVDPYAVAAGANGDRGEILDLSSTDPDGWSDDKFDRVDSAVDAVIWEISIRDFSDSDTSGVSKENRGKYLAFCEEGTTVNSKSGELSTCIDYLKELGVNYVQINPFYDFASIDETKSLDEQYNWGYDPKNYNVPEGSYSSDPYNGKTRINECKQMIQALHKAGIGVIMDVVYNHTYEKENSWFNLAVPNYYYRIDEEGTWSNGSGCGNDVASERNMVSRFIKDSVTFWADEYHIDGFRFDLMGLLDVDTMNSVRESLDKLKNGEKIIMYGEGWSLSTTTDSETKLATQDNLSLLSDRIGAFDDTIRDAIAGSALNPSDKGFVIDASKKADIRTGVEAQTGLGWASKCSQSVNYASCHDNMTLYDKLVTSSLPDGSDYTQRNEDLVSKNKLAAAIIFTSQGVPFMLSGEEFGRTKEGDSNSYKSDVKINALNWDNLNKYRSLVEYYKGLINIRKTLSLFRADDIEKVNLTYLDDTDKDVIAYTLYNEASKAHATVIFNGSSKTSKVKLDNDYTWIQIVDKNQADIKALATLSKEKVEVEAYSAAVLVDEATFENLQNSNDYCDVYVQYLDTDKNTVIYEQKLTGKKGESYSVTAPEELLFNYDIVSHNSKINGKFDSMFFTVTIKCRPYKGEFSTVNIKFLNSDGKEIANSISLTNRVGQQYYTPNIPSVVGYNLDLDSLPKNGAGKYTKKPIEVIYKYKTFEEAEKVEVEDESLNSLANVIYLGSDGEVIHTKSYLGTQGDKVEIDYLQFKGYEYTDISNSEAAFGDNETNIILYYNNIQRDYKLLIIIISSIVLLVILIAIVVSKINKQKKKNSVLIDD